MTDDRQLLEKLRQKDENAFNAVVDRYGQLAARVIFKITANADDTQDLVQEVFLSIWEQIENFRGEASITTWIYQLATNKALNHLKQKKRRQFLSISGWLSGTKDLNIPYSTTNKALEDFSRNDDQNAISLALNQLPDKQKAAFVLSKGEGLSNPEIANVLNVSVSAVESLNFRAKQKLAQLLQHYYQNKNS